MAGYTFVRAPRMRSLFECAGTLADWTAFERSWSNLTPDTYLAEDSRFRRRRYAVYSIDSSGASTRQAHQAHYQSPDYNTLYGGIERWFDPIQPAIGAGPSMAAILRSCAVLFAPETLGAIEWHAEVHQFRIEARQDLVGLPTPEGIHRDGVDCVLALMIRRINIASGVTTIHTAAGTLLGSFMLADPFDAALIDDHRVYHGVTPVQPIDSALPAYRDVLVVALRRA